MIPTWNPILLAQRSKCPRGPAHNGRDQWRPRTPGAGAVCRVTASCSNRVSALPMLPVDKGTGGPNWASTTIATLCATCLHGRLTKGCQDARTAGWRSEGQPSAQPRSLQRVKTRTLDGGYWTHARVRHLLGPPQVCRWRVAFETSLHGPSTIPPHHLSLTPLWQA